MIVDISREKTTIYVKNGLFFQKNGKKVIFLLDK